MTAAWPEVPLGEVLVATSRPRRVDPTAEYRLLGVRLDGEGPFLRETKTGAQISATTLSKVEVGDFIYSRLFAWRGAFGLIPVDLDGCYVSGEFPTFRAVPDRLDLSFLRYWFRLRSTLDVVLADCTGSTPLTRNRFKEEFFLRLRIPLPPLPEQRRIVARIEELQARIETVEKGQTQLGAETITFHAKMLKDAFLPYADRMTTIGDAFDVTTGSTPARGNQAYWGGQIKWVSSGEVRFTRITGTAETITELGVSQSNAKVYPANTVLLAMIGQGKTRGQCAILDSPAATNQNVAGIHVYRTAHAPEFVYWWLHARYQESRAVETGTAQPALNAQKVREIPIPLPAPEEQRKAVARLDALQTKVDELKRLQAETQKELDALMPSILGRAFAGNL